MQTPEERRVRTGGAGVRRERKILDVVGDAWPLKLPVAMLRRSPTSESGAQS